MGWLLATGKAEGGTSTIRIPREPSPRHRTFRAKTGSRRSYGGRARRKTKIRSGDCWPLPSIELPTVHVWVAKTSQPSVTRSLTAFSDADQSRDRPQTPTQL